LNLYSHRSIILTNMNKTIYHGASQIIRSPKFGAGRQYNDFGLGFYCSESFRSAAEWAVDRECNGFVSAYSLNYDGLRIINLCGPQYSPLHWLSLLFSFREFDMYSDSAHRAREYISKRFIVDNQGCDCIIGWRADNRCFMFAQEFIDGNIPYQLLKEALVSDESNRQYVLKSNRAFDRISFTGYKAVLSNDSYPQKRARELKSIRSIYGSYGSEGLYISDLIEQEVSPYDTRL